MKIDELNKLIEKSKNKNNGVYIKSCYYYAVKDGCLRLIGNRISGELQQFCYGFLVNIGSIEGYKMQKELKRLLLNIH
jgi:hypothetical protein